MKRILHGLLVFAWLLAWMARPFPTHAAIAWLVSSFSFFPAVLSARPAEIPDSYQLAAENATFQLYFDPSTLAFKVLDKRSGYVWHSNLDETAPGDRLNRTWTAFARSGISLDYLDEKATPRRASITTANPQMTVATVDQGFTAQVTFAEVGISVGVTVTLEASGVRVDIPFAAIQETGTARLHMIYVYPFFGATRADQVSGYMFIPDGCGSLIRFAAQTKAQTMFYGRYYGTDLGMTGTRLFDPQVRPAHRLSMPVIGMVHGEKQHAYIAIVEKGAAYGEIHAHPSGIITNFNFIYNAFIYNESYFQPTNRAGAGVTMIQPRTNAFDVVVHYRFLTGDDSDYVGMARSYREYLLEQGLLRPAGNSGDHIGIRLEFLAAEREKVLFWHRPIPMTTVAQMQEILDDLALPNTEVVIYGWQPLGAATMPPTKLKLERALGSLHELRDLGENVVAQGGRLLLYLDPQAALQGESGYSRRYDLAMSIMRSVLQGTSRNKRTFYFNLDALSRRYAGLREQITEKLGAGLAVDGLGYMLYSDFRDGRFANREDAIRAYQRLLAQDDALQTGSRQAVALYRPNDYLWAYTSAYYDVPITDSGYIYTNETVPFVQIVLAGYIPLYGPALNFSSNVQEDLLRHADFGVYPSFFLTHAPTADILNTSSQWIYTSSYRQWGKEVKRAYVWLDRLLGPVRGQPIVARETLADGVTATRYANGKQIIVNYTERTVRVYGVDIPAQDALVLEVIP